MFFVTIFLGFQKEVCSLCETFLHPTAFLGPNSNLMKSIKFVPDFTLRVSGFCRFVQITPASYINAYQVTRIARNTRYKHLYCLVRQ